ncbi:hypothetical protein [Streptomyces sp. NPDC050535]|uniref:hypothetical protein n=1 Tax=Streptomyces sp. NPDC050535 TaxID=3365626 RepID=UPI0037A68485
MFNRSLLTTMLTGGALVGAMVAGGAPAGAAPADVKASDARTPSACRVFADLYRVGNTIVADAETTCAVPISLSLFRDGVLVNRQSGAVAINLIQPCTPVSFDVVWKTSAGLTLTTNCF